MEYYLKTTNQIVFACIAIPAGGVMVMFSGTGGIFIAVGILMIVMHFYHTSNPVLALHDDHLEFNPALLRSKKLVKRDDVVGVEETQKGLFNTDVYRITTETEGELDIYKAAFDEAVQASFVDDVSEWIDDEQDGGTDGTTEDASHGNLMDVASG